jgi:peptidoglycan/LPS O-acetylase OafA/YrhL
VSQPRTISGDRYPALDGVRALAAFGVVLTHVGYATGRALQTDFLAPFLSRGNFGVTVFFLLSGFLLYRPFALASFGRRKAISLADYFWRRALRIYPALWVCVAFTLLFLDVFPKVNWSNWASYFLLIQTYNHHDYDPNFGQLWSLAVEVSFYALLPVLAWLVGRVNDRGRGPDAVLRRHAVVLIAMVVTTQLFNLAFYHRVVNDLQAVLWLPNYLDWFAGGMALAVVSSVPAGTTALAGPRRTLRIWAANGGTCVLIACALLGLAMLPLGMPRNLAAGLFWQWTLEHYLFLGAAFFLLLPIVLGRPGRTQRALGSRFASLMGSISYSVYLWHPQLMQWIQRTLHIKPFSGHFPLLLTLTTALSVVVALTSWFLLEKPLLRYASLFSPSRRATRPPSAPIPSAVTQSN